MTTTVETVPTHVRIQSPNDRYRGSEPSGPTPLDGRRKRARLVGALGNGVEWYDWSIYGLMSPFIATQFFPSSSPLAALLSTFAIFAVGFLARPIGGYVMIRFADRRGRRAAMLLSVIVMCAASLGIALCPTTESIGIAAAGILVSCRLIQGFSLGGEQPAALSYLVESAPKRRIGNFLSFYNSSAMLGILLGSAVGLALIELLGKQGMVAFGWRIPFVVGALLAVVAFFARRGAPERSVPRDRRCTTPLRTLAREYRRLCTLIVVCAACSGTLFFATVTALPAIAAQIGTDGGHATDASAVALGALIGQSVMIPVFLVAGWCADRFGSARVLAAGLALTAILAGPVLWALANDQMSFIAAQSVMSVACAIFLSGVFHTLVPELPVGLRFTGLAVFWLIPACVFGGLAPMAMAQLAGHGQFAVFGAFVSALTALALLTLIWYTQRRSGTRR